jgi:hypothetical protein
MCHGKGCRAAFSPEKAEGSDVDVMRSLCFQRPYRVVRPPVVQPSMAIYSVRVTSKLGSNG